MATLRLTVATVTKMWEYQQKISHNWLQFF